jgi:prepilin-type N-terminal cleavage/methylation domain-containing protein
MKQHTTQPSGFTLVEMIIVMGLMSIFMVVLTDIVVSVGDVQTESQATSSVAQDGKFLLARLSYDIQRATSISTPTNLGDTSANLVLVIGGVTQTYAVSGGNLQLTNNLGTNNLNGSDTTISAFSATRRGNVGGKETISFTFTVTSLAIQDSGAEVKTFTTTVGRR